MKPDSLKEILDAVGPEGSLARLKKIASMDLGMRSEAAKRVVKKRLQRIGIAERMRAEGATEATEAEIIRCLSGCVASTKLIKLAMENKELINRMLQ